MIEKKKIVTKRTAICVILMIMAASVCLFGGAVGGAFAEKSELSAEKTENFGIFTDSVAIPEPEAAVDADAILSIPPLPENSRYKSKQLALYSLDLCSDLSRVKTKEAFFKKGLTVLAQGNYEKTDDDPSHTAAYTVGRRRVLYGGSIRTLYVVSVRPTNGGEWYANFDFAPSRSDDSVFAENFLFAAEDVFLGAREVISKGHNLIAKPLVLVTGYSRGAACANILGLLFNAEYGTDNVFCYTFATPNTFRGETSIDCRNVFNYVGKTDMVTKLPLSEWGYKRIGTDITLNSLLATDELKSLENDTIKAFFELSPSVESYYLDRHSLTEKGLSEEGLTGFELMIFAGKQINSLLNGGIFGKSEFSLDYLSEESDFTPLIEILGRYTAEDNSLALSVLIQHMPQTYRAMIKLIIEL